MNVNRPLKELGNSGEIPEEKVTGYQGPLQEGQPAYATQNVMFGESSVLILGLPGMKPSTSEYQLPDASDLMEPLSPKSGNGQFAYQSDAKGDNREYDPSDPFSNDTL